MKPEKINDMIAIVAVYFLCAVMMVQITGVVWMQNNIVFFLLISLIPLTGLMLCYALIKHLMK